MLDEAVEEKDGGEKVKLGMVVRLRHSLPGDAEAHTNGVYRSSVETLL